MKFLNNSKINLTALALAFSLSLLTACGGGSDGEETAGNEGGEGGIIGTAKIIVKSEDVKAKEKGGNSYKTKIGKNGRYKFSKLKSGSYLLRSESKTGQLYSVAHVSKGKTVTSNVHPITDLIIRNWFKQNKLDIDAQFKGTGAIAKMPKVSEINKIETAIEGILAQALKQSGVKGSVNLLANNFEVKAGDTFNTFLSNNQVIINNNQITLIFTGDKVQTISISGKDLETDFTADKENPTTPTELRALPSGTHEIVVVWQPSTDDRGVAGYNIYRNGQLVATTPYPVYTDKNLSQGTNYDYMVEAIDGVGKKSGKANSDAVTTLTAPDTQAPPAIANLSATASDDDIALRWDITQVNDIARFIVKRGIRGMAKSKIASITANTFTDFNLNDGNYCYTVTAADAAGNKSAESAEQCALINAGGTTPPVNRTITCTSYTTLQTTTIDKDTTLNAGCYKVNSSISVNNPAKLTIKPGVKMEFGSGKYIEVSKGASLKAVGTVTQPIIFSGQETTPGFWKGITYRYSNSLNNQLDHVIVEYGETNINTVSFPSSPVRISIKNTILRKASNYGLNLYGGSVKVDSFENVILTENDIPITMPASLIGKLGGSSFFSGNKNDRIYVFSESVKEEQTWKKQSVPYYFYKMSIYNIEAPLTISAGTTLIFNAGGGLEVGSAGSLKVIGSASNPVVFTGNEATPGFWKGIMYRYSNSINNQLNYAVVEYGEININTVSFPSSPVRMSIKNTTLRSASDLGLHLFGSSVKLDGFENNTLTKNNWPVLTPIDLVGRLGKNNEFTGNNNDLVSIDKGSLVTAQNWENLDVPYFFNAGNSDITADLIIEDGTNLIFNTGSGFEVGATGSLKAIGFVNSPIIFTGKQKTPGYWKGIMYRYSDNTNNQLDYVTIEYAGSGNSSNIDTVCFPSSPVRLNITNSHISDSTGWGINLFGDDAYGCHVTLSNNTYSNNSSGNVRTP